MSWGAVLIGALPACIVIAAFEATSRGFWSKLGRWYKVRTGRATKGIQGEVTNTFEKPRINKGGYTLENLRELTAAVGAGEGQEWVRIVEYNRQTGLGYGRIVDLDTGAQLQRISISKADILNGNWILDEDIIVNVAVNFNTKGELVGRNIVIAPPYARWLS